MGTHGLWAFLIPTVATIGARLAAETRCSSHIDDSTERGPAQPSVLTRQEGLPTCIVDGVDPEMLDVRPDPLAFRTVRNRLDVAGFNRSSG